MATEDKRIDQLDPVSVLDLTSLMAMQQGTNAKKVTLQQLLDYLSDNVGAGNAVLFVAQTLTDSQKQQACGNIDAVSDIGWYPHAKHISFAYNVGQKRFSNELDLVRYDASQTGLTEEQKAQARLNIGAAAVGEGGGGTLEGAVLYTEQRLTEEQQQQARENIRWGSLGQVGHACIASGACSHAEGYSTKANGSGAHAEGENTTAEDRSTHAEGYYTTAKGPYGSHAEGHSTVASGWEGSHAEGLSTITRRKAQHVQGRYNVEDTKGSYSGAYGKYAHIVGNGTADDARSNAHTLDWAGVPWYAGDRIMLGGTGMDDENAVALMPIFVPQQLTPEQQKQACVNIGTKKTVIMEVTLGDYIQSGYGGECTVESASMTYDEVREAVNAGANVECHVSWPEDLPGPEVLLFNHMSEEQGYCEFSAYVGGGDVAYAYNCILEPDGVCWFQEQALLTDERMDKVYLSTEREQSFTEKQKAQGRANLGIDEYIDQVFLGGAW